jgi:hypothetical protein
MGMQGAGQQADALTAMRGQDLQQQQIDNANEFNWGDLLTGVIGGVGAFAGKKYA